MTRYTVFERTDTEAKILATVENNIIKGDSAEDVTMVRKLLKDGGWPNVPPDRILTGSRLWASEIKEIYNGG